MDPNLAPYAQQLLGRASDLSNQPYQQYGGPRVADLNPAHAAGMQGIMANAQRTPTYQDAGTMAGRKSFMDTQSGKYLSPESNPYLKQTFDAAAGRMADAYARGTGAETAALFNKAGSLGSSAQQQATEANQRAFGDSLSQLAANTYGQNYASERGNMINSLPIGLGMEQANLGQMNAEQARAIQNAQAQMGVGDVARDQEQAQINAALQQFLEARNAPYMQLDVLGNAISGAMGGGGVTTQTAPNPYMPNRTAGAIGGATAGAGLGGLLSDGNAYGTGAGGVLGGLLGMYA
jgi:hypothetical protein